MSRALHKAKLPGFRWEHVRRERMRRRGYLMPRAAFAGDLHARVGGYNVTGPRQVYAWVDSPHSSTDVATVIAAMRWVERRIKHGENR